MLSCCFSQNFCHVVKNSTLYIICQIWAFPIEQQIKIWRQKYGQMEYSYLIVEKTLWEKRNCSLREISSFPTMFSKLSAVDALKWVSLESTVNPLPHSAAFKRYSCGKHCEKRRNCLEQAISHFLTMFSILYSTYFSFQMHFKMLFAVSFNLDQSGNGLNKILIYGFTFFFNVSTVQVYWKVCGKKKKCVMTSHFSFLHSVFNPNRECSTIIIQFTICHLQIFCLGKG